MLSHKIFHRKWLDFLDLVVHDIKLVIGLRIIVLFVKLFFCFLELLFIDFLRLTENFTKKHTCKYVRLEVYFEDVLEFQNERYEAKNLSCIKSKYFKTLFLLKILDKIICSLSKLLFDINSFIWLLFLLLFFLRATCLQIIKHWISTLLFCPYLGRWYRCLATLSNCYCFTLALEFKQ